ncbi:MAG: ImmA/IrrE family metallo-endopeptidase [bacterium]
MQAFAEAGGIIATERRLLASLGMLPAFELPAPSADFGGAGRPAWEAGYELAHRTRDLLRLMPDEPIENLHALIEDRLGILVIQDELPAWLAGATVAVGELRGIVVNTVGSNQNVWVRRATMAHELGHLLWDPAERLQSLTFDRHQDLDRPERANDVVEQRANAFAIELLAPQAALQGIAATSPIGRGAARHHGAVRAEPDGSQLPPLERPRSQLRPSLPAGRSRAHRRLDGAGVVLGGVLPAGGDARSGGADASRRRSRRRRARASSTATRRRCCSGWRP